MDRGFSNLPPEIILDILSRIPIKAVFACKCVCRSWLGLLETPEFTRYHLSKSVPTLLIHHATEMGVFKIVEFEDSFEMEHDNEHLYKTVPELDVVRIFDLSDGSGTSIEGSADGLLFLRNTSTQSSDHYVCNPITREYIKLPEPEEVHQYPPIVSYGFGASRLTSQYKVVRILHYNISDPNTGLVFAISKPTCQVYTLGTGSWRSTPCEMLNYRYSSIAKLLNGNLYWLARDVTASWWISCFDLEIEAFTKFRAPVEESGGSLMDIGVLKDRLCLCDNSSENETIIYLMNDEDKSWNKTHVISKMIPAFPGEPDVMMYGVKALEDGDMLMASENFSLFCYSLRTKTIAPVAMFVGDATGLLGAISYTPSFVSLKDYETETSKVFEFVRVEEV